MPVADPSSGEHLGPYRIVGRVGAGGMGVVFKAWDTRLERDVALKILHSDAGADDSHRHRLLAEGRAASALNHPNILRVYDAAVDGSTFYLVSEWLEGNSLRTELQRGKLPVKRLLDLAVQIADGLAAAHAMGIVHRDIKPENIMLARDGSARIVDFGLARSEHKAGATADTVAPTETVSLDGGISGTPAYMSPEQARGTLGDFRTDQFSFGALLYEMATGTRAFRRDTTAETLTAVLHDEPRPVAELNQRIPAPLRWIIEQCLAKEPEHRYSATDDLSRELRRIRDRLIEALSDARLDAPGASRGRWRQAALAAGLVIVTIGAMLLVLSPRATVSMTFLPFASAAQYEGEPAWSFDGQSLVYVADVDGVLQVFAKRAGDAVSRQVTAGRFDAQHPFWSPNGQLIYFISLAGDRDALWSVGVTGGQPEIVLTNVTRAAIEPSGQRLALLRDDETTDLRKSLWWSAPPGAEPTREERKPLGDVRGTDGRLAFSPHGKLLFWVNGVGQDQANPTAFDGAFYLIPPDDGAVKAVFGDLSESPNLPGFTWLADDRRVILALPDPRSRSRHLWIADTVSGSARQLTATHTNETDPVASPDGRRIAYASDEVDFDLSVITPDGQVRRPLLATARNEYAPVWAPGGDRYAFVTDRSGPLEVWARSTDGQWERPIVTATDFGSSASQTLGALSFSPDGQTLAYQRSGGGAAFSIWLSPVGGGAPTRLVESDQSFFQDAPTWSPDGNWIAFTQNTSEDRSGRTVLMKKRIGAGEPTILADGVAYFTQNAWSPDGQWVLFQTAESLMRVRPDGGKAEAVSSDQFFAYEWAPDSRHIFALTESEATGHFALVEIDSVSGQMRTVNADLGPVPIANQPIRGFSFAPGKGFLTSLASARSDIWLLDGFEMPRRGILDWFTR